MHIRRNQRYQDLTLDTRQGRVLNVLSQLAQLLLERGQVVLQSIRGLLHVLDGELTALGPGDLCDGCNGLADVPQDPILPVDPIGIVVLLSLLDLPLQYELHASLNLFHPLLHALALAAHFNPGEFDLLALPGDHAADVGDGPARFDQEEPADVLEALVQVLLHGFDIRCIREDL